MSLGQSKLPAHFSAEMVTAAAEVRRYAVHTPLAYERGKLWPLIDGAESGRIEAQVPPNGVSVIAVHTEQAPLGDGKTLRVRVNGKDRYVGAKKSVVQVATAE